MMILSDNEHHSFASGVIRLIVHLHESKGDVLHGLSECIIWDVSDRREKVLPRLEVAEVCCGATGFLVAISELTGAHLQCGDSGGGRMGGAPIGAVAVAAEELVSVAGRRRTEREEVAQLGGGEVKSSGVARPSLHYSASQGLFCNLNFDMFGFVGMVHLDCLNSLVAERFSPRWFLWLPACRLALASSGRPSKPLPWLIWKKNQLVTVVG